MAAQAHSSTDGLKTSHLAASPTPPEDVNADLRPFLVALTLAVGSVIALNASVDVSGLTNQEALAAVVAEQRAGDLIISDELGYQRAWLKTRLLGHRREACPDLLILGSSTSGGLASEMFPGRTILNGWLGGPTIEDFEAFTSVLRRAPCVPRVILLGVDPWWSANGLVDDQRWQSVRSDFLDYQKERNALAYGFFWSRLEWNRLAEQLNFTTTKESATLLISRNKRDARPAARVVHLSETEACAQVDALAFRHMRSFDGHYTQCPKYRPSPATLQQYATRWLSGNMHRMAEWTDLDTNRLARLETVIDAWRALGARVVLSGNPYHPETYARLHDDPRTGLLLRRLDLWLDRAMTSRGSVFVNLRDPARHGCAADQFEDADHGTPPCMREIASKISQAAQF